jgi:hypothetical protein
MLLRFSTPAGQTRLEFNSWPLVLNQLSEFLKTSDFYLASTPTGPALEPKNLSAKYSSSLK